MKLPSLFLLLAFSSVATSSANEAYGERELLSNIISFADKIQNAVPTVPTTPFPTESPTYSAAPSPNPSGSPTDSPTVSMQPSIQPTNYPTVSHAPTNFPTYSASPSASPSEAPTELPSASPSKSPTMSPTISAKPSTSPSVSPTEFPSSSPSVSPTELPSSSPSHSPTNFPTVSASPTLMYYETLQANTSIPLRGIESPMNATQILVMESIIRFFIQNQVHIEGALLVTSIEVHGQRVIDLKTMEGKNEKDLIVDFTVQAEYESLVHPDDFDFKREINTAFTNDFSLFKSDLLDTADPFFAPLDPAYVKHEEDSNVHGFISIIIASIVASLCSCGTAYYAIRKARTESLKGDKLNSEMPMYPNDPVGSDVTDDDHVLTYSKSVEIIKVSNSASPEKDAEEHNVSPTNHGRETPQKDPRLGVETINGAGTGSANRESAYTEQVRMSPNSMEAGTRLGALAESILRSESFGSNRDPPTDSNRYLYAPKVTKGDPAAKYRTAAFGVPRPERQERHHDQRDDLSAHIKANRNSNPTKRDPSVIGASNFDTTDIDNFFNRKDPEQRGSGHSRGHLGDMRAHAEQQRARADPATNNDTGRFNRGHDWPAEAGQDAHLVLGPNGRVGSSTTFNTNSRFEDRRTSKEPAPSSPTSSAVSSSINAFLNMVGGTLGAAPLASPMTKGEEKKEERNQTFQEALQREGLYDVFAPSGALGIVVDTTKDGPAVHSLKQTSPMLGLINPGDLIVGLDQQDTRSMTAATLTRLMASKSNQKERKITLLASDY